MEAFRDMRLFVTRLPAQSIARLAAVMVLSAISFRATVHAVPITYKLVVHARGIGIPSSTSGAVSFGGSNRDAVLTFILEGDTANVVSFSIESRKKIRG
jgi:hypothetical protein